MFRKEIRMSIWAIFLLSLGGFIVHYRIHPPSESSFNLIPLIFTGLGVILLPLMFNCRKTVAIAYLINVAAVVVGTVTMAWESIEHWSGPVTFKTVVFYTTFPDIVILLAKLPLGHQILMHFRGEAGEAEGSEEAGV